MKKGLRNLLLLPLLLSMGLDASEGILPSKQELRILDLLPYIVRPPLVDPCLPVDFALGERGEDPYFTQGYYWGSPKTIESYFNDPTSLNGCLIRAQVSTNVSQTGLDRFSNDGKTNDLTAAGFTEIKINKGKWGIFPFREIHAKGPKGRHYYQLWVGLNDESGATIYFQLLYPDYLNEPTQNQKTIWNDFVRKTSFLNFQDLLVFHERRETRTHDKYFRFSAQKRLLDNKFSIHVEVLKEETALIIREIKEHNLAQGHFQEPYIEMQVDIQEGDKLTSKTYSVLYTPVEHFSFPSQLLNPNNLQVESNYFLLFLDRVLSR